MIFLNRLIRRLSIGEYSIIYRRIDSFPDDSVFSGEKCYRILNPTFRYWYADPVPFEINGHTYVFMEMMDYRTQKGVIGVSVFTEEGVLSNPRVVICEDFHMSFPHIFCYDGNVYMVPETSEAEQLRIYKMIDNPYNWELIRIFENVGRLVDTITYQKNGSLYLLSCELGRNQLKTRLKMYSLDSITGGILNELLVEDDRFRLDCRNAGAFIRGGCTYRVAQGSTDEEYGVNISLNEVTSFSDRYLERRISDAGIKNVRCRILPVLWKKKGIHTYGISGQYEILDILVGKISIKRVLQPILRMIHRKW